MKLNKLGKIVDVEVFENRRDGTALTAGFELDKHESGLDVSSLLNIGEGCDVFVGKKGYTGVLSGFIAGDESFISIRLSGVVELDE